VEGLREVARQNDLEIRGDRAALFDRITDFFERTGWPEGVDVISHHSGEPSAMAEIPLRESQFNDRVCGAPEGTRAGGSAALLSSMRERLHPEDLQQLMRTVTQAFEDFAPRTRPEARGTPPMNGLAASCSAENASVSGQNWSQIKFTTKLIPAFAGRDDENVIQWIERIGSIGRLYRVSDEVLLLSAVSQLNHRALEWYNRQPVESVATWEELKFQLRRYFERRETYTSILNRVSARTWKIHAEKFMDYAEDKLRLMQ